MEFLTEDESSHFLEARKIDLRTCGSLATDNRTSVSHYYPSARDLYNYSSRIAYNAVVNDWAFLFIGNDGIFSSSGNTNLYYTLREYHGDHRTIASAPGHIFLKHEKEDLSSFLSVVISNSYDAILLSDFDYSRFHFSHDGFLDVHTTDQEFLKETDAFFRRQ